MTGKSRFGMPSLCGCSKRFRMGPTRSSATLRSMPPALRTQLTGAMQQGAELKRNSTRNLTELFQAYFGAESWAGVLEGALSAFALESSSAFGPGDSFV